MKPPAKAGSRPALQGSDFSTTSGGDEAQSSSGGITCLVTVLPVGAVHALEAAGGLPLNDALPRARQAVPAAVGERHLQEKSPSRLMVPMPYCGKILASTKGIIAWLMLDEEPQMLTSSTHRKDTFCTIALPQPTAVRFL